MITTVKKTTKVKFGQNGIASISVEVNHLTLTLKQLKVEKRIGEKGGSADDSHPLPKIEFDFPEIESIDVLIEALQNLRKNHSIFQLAKCC